MIRDREKAEVSQAEGLLERLQQELDDLRRRDAELKQLLHTENHIRFLQVCKNLQVYKACTADSLMDIWFAVIKAYCIIASCSDQCKCCQDCTVMKMISTCTFICDPLNFLDCINSYLYDNLHICLSFCNFQHPSVPPASSDSTTVGLCTLMMTWESSVSIIRSKLENFCREEIEKISGKGKVQTHLVKQS